MNFGFSEEQDLLRSQVRKLLDAQCPLPTVRQIAASPEGHAPATWKQLAELGLLGLLVSERHGGAGLGWVDLVCLLEECGRGLFPLPVLDTALVASLLESDASEAQQSRWLPPIASGQCIATTALLEDDSWFHPDAIRLEARADGASLRIDGSKRHVSHAGLADLFLVPLRVDGRLRLALLPADSEGLACEDASPLDRTKPAATLRFDGVRIDDDALLPEEGEALLCRLLDRGAIAVSAETIGVCEGILSLTNQYAKDRVQFGSPIGRYQGVKHPLAELYTDIECLKSLVYYAAWSLDEGGDDLPLAAARAKAWAAESVCRAGVTGIQLHGAVGYTEEYDIQLYLKRSKWARAAMGDEDHHYARIADVRGL